MAAPLAESEKDVHIGNDRLLTGLHSIYMSRNEENRDAETVDKVHRDVLGCLRIAILAGTQPGESESQ